MKFKLFLSSLSLLLSFLVATQYVAIKFISSHTISHCIGEQPNEETTLSIEIPKLGDWELPYKTPTLFLNQFFPRKSIDQVNAFLPDRGKASKPSSVSLVKIILQSVIQSNAP